MEECGCEGDWGDGGWTEWSSVCNIKYTKQGISKVMHEGMRKDGSHSRSAALTNVPNLSTTCPNPLSSTTPTRSSWPIMYSLTRGVNTGTTRLSPILKNINSWCRKSICWYATRLGKKVDRNRIGGGWGGGCIEDEEG